MEICQHLLAYLGSFSFLILSEWNYGTGFEDKHVIDIANEVRNILEGKAWALHDRIQENHWLPKLIVSSKSETILWYLEEDFLIWLSWDATELAQSYQ